MKKTKKILASIMSIAAITSSICIANVSERIDSHDYFGKNYWKYQGCTSTSVSNGKSSYHKTYCMWDGASDTNYKVNSEGHFYYSQSGKNAKGSATVIWYDKKGRQTSKGQTIDWGYADAYATYTTGWGLTGHYAETYHNTDL